MFSFPRTVISLKQSTEPTQVHPGLLQLIGLLGLNGKIVDQDHRFVSPATLRVRAGPCRALWRDEPRIWQPSQGSSHRGAAARDSTAKRVKRRETCTTTLCP